MSQTKNHRSSKHKLTSQRRKGTDSRVVWVIVASGVLLTIGALFILLRASTPNAGNQQANPIPQVTGAPRVSVSQDTLDYGYVKLDTPINAVFNVRNVGDEPLEILGEPRVELVEGC
jgi:hypothetical protein